MTECKLNLEKCESYCNEKQVFPAMRYFVEQMKLPVKAAAKEVYNLTSGLVTSGRAEQVWIRRMGPATNVAQSEASAIETEENQEVAAESDSVEINKEIAQEAAKGTAKFITTSIATSIHNRAFF